MDVRGVLPTLHWLAAESSWAVAKNQLAAAVSATLAPECRDNRICDLSKDNMFIPVAQEIVSFDRLGR